MSSLGDLLMQMFQQPAHPHTPSPYLLPDAPGLLQRGNIDMTTRPLVRNPDGSVSTIRSMSYSPGAGREVLIPTVSNEGTIMKGREAVPYWGGRGQNLGVFSNPEDADAYAQKLHEMQARYFGLR
jgi:hypothetical protein